jgi:hypothetical protein
MEDAELKLRVNGIVQKKKDGRKAAAADDKHG